MDLVEVNVVSLKLFEVFVDCFFDLFVGKFGFGVVVLVSGVVGVFYYFGGEDYFVVVVVGFELGVDDLFCGILCFGFGWD